MVHCSVWLPLLLLHAVLAARGPSGGDTTTTSDSGVGTSTVFALSSSSSAIQPAATTPATSATPSISLATPPNTTTCAPLTLYWYTNTTTTASTNLTVRLIITNDQVPQPAPSHAASTTPIFRPITNTTFLAPNNSFHWPAVSVPPGWYKLALSSPTYPTPPLAQSSPFLVTLGSNSSCVYPNNTTTAQSHSTTRLTPGAWAGTVVGSVVGAAALLGAFALPRLWRRGVPGHQAWKDKRGGLYRVF